MAKIALLVLALAAVATAKPLGLLGGYGVAQKTAHVSHHQIISPYLGLGYGMMGLGGLGGLGVGQTVSHSISHHHVVPHLGLGIGGLGLKGLGMGGYYPGGIGLGYGYLG